MAGCQIVETFNPDTNQRASYEGFNIRIAPANNYWISQGYTEMLTADYWVPSQTIHDGGVQYRADYTVVYYNVPNGCQNFQPPPIPPNTRYDCLNGGCIPKTTYGTPGVFPSLAACQSGCATNSTCTGECVLAEELAALQQAANTVRPRLCP